MSFGERLKKLREEKDLTQTQLAEILNIPNQSISNYERDYRKPDYETLSIIADYFNVSTDYLIKGNTSKNQDGNLHFFDFTGLNEKEIEDIKSHIEFVKWKARDKQ